MTYTHWRTHNAHNPPMYVELTDWQTKTHGLRTHMYTYACFTSIITTNIQTNPEKKNPRSNSYNRGHVTHTRNCHPKSLIRAPRLDFTLFLQYQMLTGTASLYYEQMKAQLCHRGVWVTTNETWSQRATFVTLYLVVRDWVVTCAHVCVFCYNVCV